MKKETTKKLSASVFAVMIALSLLLTGCGGSGSESKSSDPGQANQVQSNVDIGEGEEGMEVGLDFEGKSFRLAYSYTPNDKSYLRKIEAFNKKFNANVQPFILNWDTFNTELAVAKQGGTPYDIIFYHSEFFPFTSSAGLLAPLESYVTEADFADPKSSKLGGLDRNMTMTFAWKNQIYAAASVMSVFPEVMYYNKLLFREYSLDDPYELYKQGKWTWEALQSMGNEVRDASSGVYLLGGFSNLSVWLALNAVNGITYVNNAPQQNFQDTKFIQVMNAYKEIFHGNNALSTANIDEGSDADRFAAGETFMHIEVIDGYSHRANSVRSSNAFGKKIENLGFVPLPSISTNPEGLYAAHAPQGWAAGAGSPDPRIAVAFAKFESSWIDEKPDDESVPPEVRQIFIDVSKKNGLFGNMAGYQDNDGTTYFTLLNRIAQEVIRGGDVAAVLDTYRNQVQKCVVDSMAK